MLALLLHAFRATGIAPYRLLVRRCTHRHVQHSLHALLVHDLGCRFLHFPGRQTFLPLFAFVQRREFLDRLLQAPLQLLVLSLRIAQRSHEPAPFCPDDFLALDFPLQLHVQGEPLSNQLLCIPLFRGAVDLLQGLPAFPDRLQQRATFLYRELRFRQRSKVKVLGACQVSPGIQRCSLAVHDIGLTAFAEGLLHLLDLRDVQRVVGAIARDDHRGDRHAKRVEGRHGDLDLRLIVAIFAMTELEQTPLGENLDVGIGGGGVDANEVCGQVVDADGVLVEILLNVLPTTVQGEVIEHIGESVVLKVEGTNGFAQTGLQGVEVGFHPRLHLGKTVVALGGDKGEPDAGDLPERQLALPAVSGKEVTIKDLVHLQPL